MKPEERERVLDVFGCIAPGEDLIATEEDLYLIHEAIVKAAAEMKERCIEVVKRFIGVEEIVRQIREDA